MKTLSSALLACSFLLASTAAGRADERYVEGEVIVTFKPSRDLDGAKKSLQRRSLGFSQHFGWLSTARKRQTGVVRSGGQSTVQLIEQLKGDPEVESVEPNYLRTVKSVPNDPDFGKLWGLANTGQNINGVSGTPGADVKFIPAMELVNPSAGPAVVGVIDTGIDRRHPDLLPNLWVNPGEIPFNGIDDDGNGKVDDYHGFDFTTNTNDISDSGSHGTHVAGTVAAVGNNAVGVIGTNPRAKIMALKVSSDGTHITTAATISAIQYAVQMKTAGVNLVALNASYGGPGFSSAEQSAIQAAGDAGIVLCALAGNETADNDVVLQYPASYRLPNMIVVAASDQNDALASFSNRGATSVDLAAPGDRIYSTAPATVAMSLQVGATTYSTTAMKFGGASAPISGTLYDCSFGNTGEFPPGVSGNIALISRGVIVQRQKALNAMAAGAKAVIVYNSAPGTFFGTLDTDADDWIPVGTISQADGVAIKSSLPVTATGTVTATLTPIYQYLGGTSMATPQVTAAASLAAMNFPEDTVAQRIQRILGNVDQKPGLAGKVITGGRLNLQRILDSDANTLPDWWEKQYFNQYTGGNPTADSDADGSRDHDEFIAGTIPNNPASVLRTSSVVRSAANGNFTIHWNAVAGKTYQVSYSDSLAGGWLTDLPGSVVTTGVGETQSSFTDTTAGPAAKRFYRVEVVAP